MSWLDFQEYSRHVGAEEVAMGAANTLTLRGAPVQVAAQTEPDSTPVLGVALDELRMGLESLRERRVVYVSALFAPTEAGAPCVPHCDYERASPGLTRKLEKFESAQGCHPFHGHLLPKQRPALL